MNSDIKLHLKKSQAEEGKVGRNVFHKPHDEDKAKQRPDDVIKIVFFKISLLNFS